jgi:hypothetical protein
MIESAALKLGNLIISMPRPARHHNIIHELFREHGIRGGEFQGFLTSEGKFVDREEAWQIAFYAGQLKDKDWHQHARMCPHLFSEDIW